MTEHSQSRRGFLYAAFAAGMVGKAAFASTVHVSEQQERDFEFEGHRATEFLVRAPELDELPAGKGAAIELYDPAAGQPVLVPIFEQSGPTEERFEQNLRASVQAHGSWHQEQGREAPAIHIHLIRITNRPNLRALLVHPGKCVLTNRPLSNS